MNILRFLRPACIQLPLACQPLPFDAEEEEATPALTARRLAKEKQSVMEELAAVLSRADDVIINPTKLLRDLEHRERNATTALGNGVAIPHVRTLQARSFLMGIAVAAEPGLAYGALDGEPVRLFLLMAAPPYDDRLYHQAHREAAMILRDEDMVAELLAATSSQDVFNSLRRFFR